MLAQFGLVFTIVAAAIDETPTANDSLEEYVQRMAQHKARDVGQHHPQAWIVGADTAISLDGKSIIGKPETPEDALSILSSLSGRTHQVITGLCLHRAKENICLTETVSTMVTFINASRDLLRAYIATGEPMDKAGAYGIQGLGTFLVREISGSCSNVIGLPLSRLIALFLEHGIIVPRTIAGC